MTEQIVIVLLSANLAGVGAIWYRLGNLSARVASVETGGACREHCAALKRGS